MSSSTETNRLASSPWRTRMSPFPTSRSLTTSSSIVAAVNFQPGLARLVTGTFLSASARAVLLALLAPATTVTVGEAELQLPDVPPPSGGSWCQPRCPRTGPCSGCPPELRSSISPFQCWRPLCFQAWPPTSGSCMCSCQIQTRRLGAWRTVCRHTNQACLRPWPYTASTIRYWFKS